jgi:hypothetical protein
MLKQVQHDEVGVFRVTGRSKDAVGMTTWGSMTMGEERSQPSVAFALRFQFDLRLRFGTSSVGASSFRNASGCAQ